MTGNQTRERTNPTGYDPPERLRSCGLCARRSATIGDAPVTVLNVRHTTIYRCNHPVGLGDHRLTLRCCASALLFFRWRIGFIRRRLDFGALGFAQRSFLVSLSLFLLAPSTCPPRSLGSISSVIWLKCHHVPRWLITHLLALYNHVAMPSPRHVFAPNS